MSSRHGTNDCSGYYGSAPAGLVVTAPNGREKLVMSDQEICDDVVATVPKLNTAVARDTYGRRWKQGHRRHGVDLFELSTATGEEAVDEDRDIAYAVCVHRVDSCVFDDEDLLEALGPAVVAVDDALWCNDDKFHLDVDGDTASMTSESSSVEELTDQLYSDDPSQHSHALDFLGQLVNPVAASLEYEFMSPAAKRAKSRSNNRRKKTTKVQRVARNVENYLSQSLRDMKDRYSSLDHYAKFKQFTLHPLLDAPMKIYCRLNQIDNGGEC
ncbi:uncharacterized protein KRP23_280 [Phytophthora ramorum]|uniref:uncharacterized protein n=1 Tax=Phytophthora ramorum TaxID=164328 RepID=UPI0030B318E6|nr:hypothetical protein KRP23_280 [Phytophthora ramorum]